MHSDDAASEDADPDTTYNVDEVSMSQSVEEVLGELSQRDPQSLSGVQFMVHSASQVKRVVKVLEKVGCTYNVLSSKPSRDVILAEIKRRQRLGIVEPPSIPLDQSSYAVFFVSGTHAQLCRVLGMLNS